MSGPGIPDREQPYLFVREMMGDRPGVALARRDLDGRHARLWATAFELPVDRETLFAWLEANAGFWPILGALCATGGPAALSARLDAVAEAEAASNRGTLLQVYRAAAYLTCTEEWLLAFRERPDCALYFTVGPDPLLSGRGVPFVDLGGLIPRMIGDAIECARERWS